MKEIKLRVWDGNKMAYFGHSDFWWLRGDGLAYGCHNGGGDPDRDEIENAIIMQWTGLKDMNGKDVYEGDIVQQHPDWKYNKFQVKWYDDCAGYSLSSSSDYEVIGNIYEHPHLLDN